MVKSNIPDIRVPELIADMWAPLNEEQRAYLSGQFTLQTYKKNEVIHCEGETPKHLMCLLSGKVKISTILTRVANSQPRVVANPPSTKFRMFKTVRIKPRFTVVFSNGRQL